MIFWNYWLAVAFIAPTLWAIVNLIDVYFVGEVFDDELDGITIMGLFQILPWLAIFFLKFTMPSTEIVLLAILAGFLNIVAMYFYFKALFTTNDASVVALFWNISILLLPIIAFFVVGEKLTPVQYGGLFVAFLGASLISMDSRIKERNLWKIFLIMMGADVFLSISMAISDKVYKTINFFDGFLLYSFGAFVCGVFFMLVRLKSAKKKERISLLKLDKKYFFWFFLAEFFTLLGLLFSQRAIDLSPAVSFISAIESAQAFFILVISAMIYVTLSIIKNKNREIIKSIYRDQLIGYKVKILASIIIAIGIYMLNA